MPSLSETYERGRWEGRDPRRVYVGGALFALGSLAVVAAIFVVTTGFGSLLGAASDTAAKRLAGVLAGLGTPAILAGVVAVLPSSRRQRWGVVLGVALTVGGVALFDYAYPTRWTGTGQSLAFETAMLYFVGAACALWFVLSTVATFKLRNNPQGTVELELTRRGDTETVRVSRDQYRRYRRAARSDGGRDEELVREIESLTDEE